MGEAVAGFSEGLIIGSDEVVVGGAVATVGIRFVGCTEVDQMTGELDGLTVTVGSEFVTTKLGASVSAAKDGVLLLIRLLK